MQYEQVKELIEIFERTDLNDMDIKLDNTRIRLNRGLLVASQPAAAPQPAPPAVAVVHTTPEGEAAAKTAAGIPSGPVVPVANPPAAKETKVIKAPIVGTFYQSAAPDEPPFVKVGDRVAEGDVVCIIEAMKFMNEVNSELSGTITEVLVGDGEFVEYGQELFRIQ